VNPGAFQRYQERHPDDPGRGRQRVMQVFAPDACVIKARAAIIDALNACLYLFIQMNDLGGELVAAIADSLEHGSCAAV